MSNTELILLALSPNCFPPPVKPVPGRGGIIYPSRRQKAWISLDPSSAQVRAPSSIHFTFSFSLHYHHHCPEPQPLFPGSRRSLLTRSSVFALPSTLLQTCPTQCHQRHEKDPVVPLLKPLQSFPGAFQNCPPPTPTPRLSWVFICVPSSLEALSRQWCCAASNSTIGADKLSRRLTSVSDVNTTPQWRLQERGGELRQSGGRRGWEASGCRAQDVQATARAPGLRSA